MIKNVIIAKDIAFTRKGIRVAEKRTLGDLKYVLLKEPTKPEEVAYLVFRDVDVIPLFDLRIDVTKLRAEPYNSGELPRTHGHYHPEGPFGIWPEIYSVVKGHALFILQDITGRHVKLVEVKEGEILLIPPGYGHIMVNVGNEELITFNVVSKSFKPSYEEYRAKRGPAVFIKEGLDIVRNPNYDVVEIKWCMPIPLPSITKVLHYAYKPPYEEWLICE